MRGSTLNLIVTKFTSLVILSYRNFILNIHVFSIRKNSTYQSRIEKIVCLVIFFSIFSEIHRRRKKNNLNPWHTNRKIKSSIAIYIVFFFLKMEFSSNNMIDLHNFVSIIYYEIENCQVFGLLFIQPAVLRSGIIILIWLVKKEHSLPELLFAFDVAPLLKWKEKKEEKSHRRRSF